MSECFNCKVELLGDTDITLCDDCYRMKVKTYVKLVSEIKNKMNIRLTAEQKRELSVYIINTILQEIEKEARL